MIFLSNAAGVITAAIPEPINQGSIGVNRIVLIAPFPATAVVSATFTLPNGIKLYPRYVGEEREDDYPYLMGVVEAFGNKGLTIDGLSVNAWQLTLDKAITQVAGKVTVQFLVTGSNGTLTTTSATLPINRGNAYISPSVDQSDFDTITQYLAAAKEAMENAEAAEDNANAAADRAELAADRYSPWDVVANQETALAALEAARYKSILFLNVDFTVLNLDRFVTDGIITFNFPSTAKKVEFRGCDFGDRYVRLLGNTNCLISGASGEKLVIKAFGTVENCTAEQILNSNHVTNCTAQLLIDTCENVTGSKSVNMVNCTRVSASQATTFTSCTYVDPYSVSGRVGSSAVGTVPVLTSNGSFVPAPLASGLSLTVNPENSKVTATLRDRSGNVMSSATIDLPLKTGDGEGSPVVQSVNGKTGEVVLNASDVGARPSTWTPTYSEVGADKSGTASSLVGVHNTDNASHNDIRLLIEGLSSRLNALANSDDTTLDQMKEVVDYIKANRGLIEGITTNKINYSDIVDNLTTNTSGKPLSAAQGVVLKALVDGLANDKLDASALANAINTALAQAKESGEFDGTSVTVSSVTESTEDGGSNVVNFSDGKTVTVKNGKGGADGFSVYKSTENHPEKGEDIALDLSISEIETGGRALQVGDFVILDTYLYVITRLRYPSGADAALCFNMHGDDYVLTDADKAEIAETVKAEVPLVKTAEQPTFVDSVDKMTDTSKVYVTSDMSMWAYMLGGTPPYIFTAGDFVADAVNTNGALLGNGTPNRIATASMIDLSAGTVSVYCPAPYQYIVYYYTDRAISTYIGKTAFKSGNTSDVLNDTVASGTIDGAKYCRISLRDNTDTAVDLSDRIDEFVTNVIISQSSETTDETYSWQNTGYSYNQPVDYEDRIVALEKALEGVENGTY